MNKLTELFAFIEQHKNTPFAWGKFDCCLFAADAITLLTGNDPAAEFRGKYSTALGAKRVLKRYGNGDLVNTLIAKLGEPKAVLCVNRGDAVLINNNNDPAVGICLGNFVAVVTTDGLKTVALNKITLAWEVLCHP
ncbi:MAG: hypothetical protein COB35_05050 [Gammaproteobacteria bacterium]|nr:MAG: hypothetical protein COB35_05050 [Gammaproteobacteria bacterium]